MTPLDPASQSVTTLDPPRAAEASPAALQEERELEGRPEVRDRFDHRGYRLRRWMAVADAVALVAAYGVATAVHVATGRGPLAQADLAAYVALIPCWVFIAALLGLYHQADRRVDHSVADELGSVVLAATVWGWAFLIARAAVQSGAIDVLGSVVAWTATIVLVLLFRFAVRKMCTRARWYRQAVAVVGAPGDIARIHRRVVRHPEWGLDIEREIEAPLTGLSAWEPWEVARLISDSGVSRVIFASADGDLAQRTELCRTLIRDKIHVDLVSGEPDAVSSRAALHYVEGLPMLSIPARQEQRVKAGVKRVVDLVGSLAGLVVLSPLIAYCAVRIKLGSEGPVFFRQERVGRERGAFRVFKFRTMVADADAQKHTVEQLNFHTHTDTPGMFKVPDDPRITKFGTWLRRWSLDELPQLVNVVKGEMSLVGPRPLIADEADLIRGTYEVRFDVKPGITGPWQTLGRSDIGFDDMMKLDYTYALNPSLREDVKLLVRTAEAVAKGSGAY